MNILLFGVSNVGKSVTGELLATRLGFAFYDLDEEVKKRFHTFYTAIAFFAGYPIH